MAYNFLYNAYKIFYFLLNLIILNFYKFFLILSLYTGLLYNIVLLFLKFNNKANLKFFYTFSLSKFFFCSFLNKYIFNIEKGLIHKPLLYKLYGNKLKFLKANNLFNNINFNMLDQFLNLNINKNVSFSGKYYFKFFILNNSKKLKIIKKIKINKNLFSLFALSLFIYLFLVYLFIYWLNNLFNSLLKLNKAQALNIFYYNKKLFFYKVNFSYSLINKKIIYKEGYYLSNINKKVSNYYLIYNKLNLFKIYNI